MFLCIKSISIDKNWSCQVLNTFSIKFLFFWITLLPHKRVTQRQDPHMGKCLDIQLSDIFLMSSGCFRTITIKVVTGNCPSHWPTYHMYFISISSSWVHRFLSDDGDNGTFFCLFLLKTDQWIELVDQNYLCITVALFLVNFNFICAIWAGGHTAQVNLKTV